MPPKKKKSALKEDDVQVTVDLVMKRWPNMNINTGMIKNPTREFVLYFYRTCIEELENTIVEANRSSHLPGHSGLSDEEALFFKLGKIPVLRKADFKLGDLYQFDPFRLNTHIHILTHFMFFTKNITNEAISICDKVFDAKEQLKKMEEGHEKLIQSKQQKELELKNLQERNIDLKNTAANLMPDYEQTMDLIEKSEEKCKDKIYEIEKLKEALKNLEEEIQQLEKTEQDLRSQVISESEYNMLKEKLATLKLEERNLVDIDLNNFLFEQNKHIEQLQMCVVKLDQLSLSDDIYKLSEYRTQLENEKHSLQYFLNLRDNEKEEIKHKQSELEKEETSKGEKNKQLKNLQIIADEVLLKLTELDERKQEMSKENHSVIEKTEALNNLLKNCDILHADMEQKYNVICDIQDKALLKFRNFVSKRIR